MEPPEFTDLFENNASGSSALLNAGVRRIISQLESGNINWQSFLTNFIKDVRTKWPHFSVAGHFVSGLDPVLKSGNKTLALAWVRDYQSHWRDLDKKWAEQLQDLIPGVITVHSQSESVKKTLLELKKKGLNTIVFQMLSAPINEGEAQGKWLEEAGFDVTIAVDALSAYCVGKSDMVVLGADSVYYGGFMNKIGSLNLCMAAELYNVPVYVIIDSRKIVEENPVEEHTKPSEEVVGKDSGLKAVNFYFELVPHKYVTKYVTEEGLKKPGELFG